MVYITLNRNIKMSIEKLEARASTNPYAVKIAKSELTTNSKDVYENLVKRTTVAFNPNRKERRAMASALKSLRKRMGKDTVFESEHFGYVEMVRLGDMVINIDNQRDVDWDHVAYILEQFDPRIVQVVNTIKLNNDLYSVPEGQHTVVALYILMKEGFIPADTLIACKVIPADLMVPGSPVKGEGFGNLLFRIINYKGRKTPDPYFMLRSRVNGVRLYGSELQEDVHAEQIMTTIENNNMYCRPAVEARGQGAQPGMITYIAGLTSISEFDTDGFDDGIEDLNWALGCHDEKFNRQKGVDGGFILAFGRYAKLARKTKVTISATHRAALLDFMQETYGSPAKFHKECKKRLKNFQRKYDLKEAWSDSCLLSVMIIDFDEYCTQKGESYPVLNDQNLNKFKSL
jgi:hypothetical protein